MGRAFTALTFTGAVKAAQVRYGARDHALMLASKEPANDRLTADLTAFIGQVDSLFIGTANREGWPHLQHRGGPAGFLNVLDDCTLAFADYAGNKQYITVGNLSENDRVMLLLLDYEQGRRLKIWGRGEVLEDDPPLLQRVHDPAYCARAERVIRVQVEAWDFNCRKHLPRLTREHTVQRLAASYEERLAKLQARYDALLAGMFAHE